MAEVKAQSLVAAIESLENRLGQIEGQLASFGSAASDTGLSRDIRDLKGSLAELKSTEISESAFVLQQMVAAYKELNFDLADPSIKVEILKQITATRETMADLMKAEINHREAARAAFEKQARMGMQFGWLAQASVLILSGYCVYTGHPTEAAAMVAGIVAPVSIFVLAGLGKTTKAGKKAMAEQVSD